MSATQTTKWPKTFPPLSAEEKKMSDDFMKLWHEVLPKRFGVVEKFNHSFPVKASKPGFKTTLEIGAGLGEHINYEKLTAEQESNYYALEIRENMAAEIRKAFPKIKAIVGDCQARLEFEDGFFDRVIAVHVLEHLPNLPECIKESWRLLNKKRGQLLIVIPTEGSFAYSMARKVSAERLWNKHFDIDYSWFYKREHINLPDEIQHELSRYFTVDSSSYFPMKVPFVFANLCIGLSLTPRQAPAW